MFMRMCVCVVISFFLAIHFYYVLQKCWSVMNWKWGGGAGGNQSTGPLPQSVWEILLNCLIFCWGLQNSALGKQQWITLEGTYSNETIKARRQQNKLKTRKKYTENSKYDEGNDTEKWETGRTILPWIASWSEGPRLRSDLDMVDVWVKG